MKTPNLKPWYRLLAILLLLCVLISLCRPASADNGSKASTEVNVDAVQHITIDLGEAWAGKEFKYRTAEHDYPDHYIVSEDGVLDFDINYGSERYVLTLIRSSDEDSDSGNDTASPATEENTATESDAKAEAPVTADALSYHSSQDYAMAPRSGSERGRMVAGFIPLKYVVVFLILLLSAAVVLIVLIVRDRMDEEDPYSYTDDDLDEEGDDDLLDDYEGEDDDDLYNYDPRRVRQWENGTSHRPPN